MNPTIALKIDVDTDRGTRIGVPNLLRLLLKHEIRATFLFSLGPDNTGRAIRRIFRPGFLTKVSRTNVVGTYGLKTLLNGVLWPGPKIAKRNKAILRSVADRGFEVGIHSHDHFKWQDYVNSLPFHAITKEFSKAMEIFQDVFGQAAQTAGAPGWQANANSLAVYDAANLLYASDCRGTHPFYPKIYNTTFKTLQIPTTLPTLDELLGRPKFPETQLIDHFLLQLTPKYPNIFTIHAEIEGMSKLHWFDNFIHIAKQQGISFKPMIEIAHNYLKQPELIPVCEFIQGSIDGRSGTLAKQGGSS